MVGSILAHREKLGLVRLSVFFFFFFLFSFLSLGHRGHYSLS